MLKNLSESEEKEDFYVAGVLYEVKEGCDGCEKCAFFLNHCEELPRPPCKAEERLSKNNCIFKLKNKQQ